jgi:hypothetical protein
LKKTLFVLCLLAALSSIGFAIGPTLIGGSAAPIKDWPASVYAAMGNSRCSATVVGPRTLAIAAHCVNSGGTASFSVGANKYSSECTHSRDYDGNSTADYTLCKVDKEVTGIPYENVLMDESRIKVGDKVRLTGYGCIRAGGGGGNDGVFRIGTSTVRRLPAGNNNDVVTSGSTGALCYGDSGGGAYLEDGLDRWLFGVNSRGDISTTSYLPAWYTSQGKRFLKAWSDREGEMICGFHANARGCRSTKPKEPIEVSLELNGWVLDAVIAVTAPYAREQTVLYLMAALQSVESGARAEELEVAVKTAVRILEYTK